MAEEVYFGKAKDVVGDLRSSSAFRHEFDPKLTHFRPSNAVGDEQGKKHSPRDDQFNEKLSPR